MEHNAHFTRKAVGILALLLLSIATQCHAQATRENSAAFEVVSVRVAPTPGGLFSISASGAAEFIAENASMPILIELAFGINENQIAAMPGWFDSTFYDIKARPEGTTGLTYEQLRPMLQQLLKQRFHLVVHHQTKPVPGYALLISKGGPKLQPGTETQAVAYILPNGLRSPSLSIQSLAGMLARPLGRPVVDKTGITGNYDIDLRYAQIRLAEPDSSTETSLPSIFTALQEQLGLKLESQKVPLDMVVIDHIERVPTDN